MIGDLPDTNTIRVGLPYDNSTAVGQNRTFIAGISGTQVHGDSATVVINADGQLGVSEPRPGLPTHPVPPMSTQATKELASLQQQVREQQSTIADLRARLAQLEALVIRKARRE